MSQKKYFITGISTEVGKTVASAIITEALEADYWKPIQAGELATGDSHTVASLISNSKTTIHPNAYALKTPMSPHAAAVIDGVVIDLKKIIAPKTKNILVIDSLGVYNVKSFKPHIVLLRNSPKLNLKRFQR